jgi:flagellar biosynthesis protein FliQ
MIRILFGALVLSVVHALMPDHWIPIVIISRTENWSNVETLWVSLLVTIPHIISTILVGILVGIIGLELTSTHELIMKTIAPLILIIIGAVYIYRHFSEASHHSSKKVYELTKGSKKEIISLLATALFFSPCVPIGSYFLIAGSTGMLGISLVSTIYLLVTIIVMLFMISLGRLGLDKLNWHFLDHNENLITGIILLLLGIFIYFIEI